MYSPFVSLFSPLMSSIQQKNDDNGENSDTKRRTFSYERVWDVAHQRLCGGTWIGKHLHANLRKIQIPPPESIKNIKKYNGVLRWQLDGLHPEDCPLMYFSWAGLFL